MRSLRTLVVLLCLVLAGALVPALPAHAATNQKGTYTALTASRVLDTRVPIGVPEAGQLGPGQTLQLQVSGKSGVPASGASAVVFNLTVTGPTANGYLAAYPTGGTRPAVSSINFAKGVALANIATVPLGTGGKISIYNSTGGSVSVVADVMGFYAANDTPSQTTGAGNEFAVLDPERLVDTRTDPDGPLAANDALLTRLNFGADNATVKALAINITATAGQTSGYLTAWNGIGKAPTTSTLNYRAATTLANMAVVQTSRCTACSAEAPVQFGVYNGSSKSVGVIIDLVGLYYNDGSVGLRFSPITPKRISDSRTPLNGAPLTPNATQTLTAPSSVAGTNTIALVANAAVVAPTANTYLTLWAGGARPTASNLNVGKGTTGANGAIIGLSDTNQFNLYNQAGNGNFIIDVNGRFDIGTGSVARQQKTTARDLTPSEVTSRRTASMGR